MAHVKSWFVTGLLAAGAIAASVMSAGVAKAQDPAAAPAAAPAPAPAPAAAPATATASVGTTGATTSVDTTPVANPDLGDPGAFVIDQVSGFRGRVGGGVGFYGPLGVAYNSFSGQTGQQISFTGTSASASSTETTINSWSIWLAPSIDYFLIQNVSVGGLFAVDTSFGDAESKTTTQQATGSTITTSKADLPTVTSFTLMPRVGYFIRVNDRLSFWPRAGVGYYSGSNAMVDTQPGTAAGSTITVTRTQSISSLLVQLDVGVIYQITDNVFFRIAPAVAFSSNGSSTVKYKAGNGVNTPPEQKGDGKAFQFELSSGFGANFSL